MPLDEDEVFVATTGSSMIGQTSRLRLPAQQTGMQEQQPSELSF